MENKIVVKNISEIAKDLWEACDVLRGNLSSEQYMHVVISVILLKMLSDKMNKAEKQFIAEMTEHGSSILENKNFNFRTNKDILPKYGIRFSVPTEADWNSTIIENINQPDKIGQIIDDAFIALENSNPELKGLFEKNFNRSDLDKERLIELIKIFSNKDFANFQDDIIGRIYEYFLGNFFKKQGQKGGEFYTPISIVKLMVSIINPQENVKIYDPACGTGGMFVQTKQYLKSKNKDTNQIKVYGQEFSNQTWKLARINLIVNGFSVSDTHLGERSEDTFNEDLSGKEKFDIVLANPPFNMKKWARKDMKSDPRFEWGIPYEGNANYAWLSHILHKLNSTGRAAVVMANGAISSIQKEELAIRKKFLEENKVEAIISLPDKLFYTVTIPATIWVFNNNKTTNDILLINAEALGELESASLRFLNDQEISKIVDVYNEFVQNKEIDIKNFAKSVKLEEIAENSYSLVPSRYINYEEEEIDEETIKQEIKTLQGELKDLFKEFVELIPEVEKSIDKAIEFSNEKKKDKGNDNGNL
ncbi:type I restriction-modification system subunit M [[Mycoplasma] collis]|uniref:type I restriction-modification system subunit M n=1 Tax=[Mycoplasma] collis TaxID=2127 RepID=UPI00068B86DA|nr:type I restriction-modification system subunit M [[Mycoplasma] collis]